MQTCGDDPRGGPVRKTCPIVNDPFDADPFYCELCGNSFDDDPRFEFKTPIAKQTPEEVESKSDWQTRISGDSSTEGDEQEGYMEEVEWMNSCISVPKAIKRPKSESQNVKAAERRKKEISFGIGTKSGDYSRAEKASGSAKGVLGISGGGVPILERFSPPFDKSMLLRTKSEENVYGAAVKPFLESGLPPRKFYLRSNLPDGVPVLGQRSDHIHRLTRLAFELLLHMDINMSKPWSLTRWSKQTGLQLHFVRRLVKQGGPLSREFGKMLGKQSRQSGRNVLDKISGYIDNLQSRGIIVLSDEEEKNVVERAKELIEFMSNNPSNSQTSNSRTWCEQFLEMYCTIGFMSDEGWQSTGFWWVARGHICSDKLPMTLPSILLGQVVAQAVYEVLDSRDVGVASILNIVSSDLRWTCDDVGDNLALNWRIMMLKREQESCW
jgi:hypothetical protein